MINVTEGEQRQTSITFLISRFDALLKRNFSSAACLWDRGSQIVGRQQGVTLLVHWGGAGESWLHEEHLFWTKYGCKIKYILW
jgi:hypothetical protein